MKKDKPQKRKIVIIVILVLFVLNIPMMIQVTKLLRLTNKTSYYVKPFVEQAIEYVKTETNASERYGYGEELELTIKKRVLDYYDDKNAKFSNSDEFQLATKYMEIYIDVNDRATCVVVFEGDSEGKLEITKYFWE